MMKEWWTHFLGKYIHCRTGRDRWRLIRSSYIALLSMSWGRSATPCTLHPRFHKFACSQDTIGWRRFMERAIWKEYVKIHQDFLTTSCLRLSIRCWKNGLIIKLLEVTHGHWLVAVPKHKGTQYSFRTIASQKKEEIQHDIEKQQELGRWSPGGG